MPNLREALDRLRRWLRTPPHNLTGAQRTLRWWIDLARHCSGELRRDRSSQMAAALTYHTLFSLFPTVVLTMVVLSAFVDEAERNELRDNVLNWVLSPIQQAETIHLPGEKHEEPPAAATPGETTNEPNGRRAEFEEVRQTLNVKLQRIIDSLETVNVRSIGVVGVLIFIYAATGLLSTVERSFNTIYKAAQGRSAWVRVPIYYTVITVGPIALVAGQVLQRRFLNALEAEHWTWLIGALAVVTPLLTAWLVLDLMYMLLPNTRVSIRMASAGSFIAAALWVLAIQLFAIYVQRAAVSTLYGALGLLPLFLFWMWITWLIILFGLELSYSLQTMHEGRFRYGYERARGQVVIDRTLLLPLATRIAARFLGGELATVADLSRDLFLPERAVEQMVRALQEAGLVYLVHDRRGNGYTLARPAKDIRASQVLAASDSLLPDSTAHAGEKAWALMDRLNRSLQERTAETTLADLCGAEPAV